jgi:hypothetical protein
LPSPGSLRYQKAFPETGPRLDGRPYPLILAIRTTDGDPDMPASPGERRQTYLLILRAMDGVQLDLTWASAGRCWFSCGQNPS